MDGIILAVIGVVGTLVGGGGVWAYASLRRQASGQIATSTADQLWTARDGYEKRVEGAFDKLQVKVDKLEADYQVALSRGNEEARLRVDCERRITILEANSDAAAILAAAQKAAEKLRAEAAAAKVVVVEDAVQAKVDLDG